MGFLSILGKIFAGKPVYGPENTQHPSMSAPNGAKQVPRVWLGRMECQWQGNRFEVYVDITNQSPVPVVLDRIVLLGTRRELDNQLLAGERKQYLVYSGAGLKNSPQGYAELQYRNAIDGDYFVSYFQMRYQQTEQGYVITEFLPAGPVKDI